MSRENGESHGLWSADDQVVPLSSLSATVAPSPNGDRAVSALDDERRGQVGQTASEFVTKAIDHNVLVIPGNVFSERDTHFRISYATTDEKIAKGCEILNSLV